MTADQEVIREYCTHPDPRVRGNALSALVSMGKPKSLELFAESIHQEPDPEVLRRAVKSVEVLEADHAARLTDSLTQQLVDEPGVGPVVYNLLARLRVVHPDLAPGRGKHFWRRLTRAWRTRKLPGTLAIRRIQWASTWIAFGVAFAFAILQGLSLRPAPQDDPPFLAGLLGVSALAAFLAGLTVLVTTRRFYGVRFHFHRVAGSLIEAVRTGLTGLIPMTLVLFGLGLGVSGIETSVTSVGVCLVWSILLGFLFVATARLGVALGSGGSPGGGRWSRLTGTLGGWFSAGLVVTAVCMWLLSRSEYLATVAASWWIPLTSSAVAISWRFAALEPSWTPAPRWRGAHRGSLVALMLVGALPVLLALDLGWGAIRADEITHSFDLPIDGPGPDDVEGQLESRVTLLELTVTNPSLVRIDAGLDGGGSIDLKLWPLEITGSGPLLRSGSFGRELALLAEEPAIRASGGPPVAGLEESGDRAIVEGVIGEGRYLTRIETRHPAYPESGYEGVSGLMRQRLEGARGWLTGSASVGTPRPVGWFRIATEPVERRRSLSLGTNQLEEKTRYLLAPQEEGPLGRPEFKLELQVETAVVELFGRWLLSASEPGPRGPASLTLIRQRDGQEIELGQAEDLEMRRVLEKGAYRVILSSSTLALEVYARELRRPVPPWVKLTSGTDFCYSTGALPQRIAFTTEERGWQAEAFDLQRRDIVLEAYEDRSGGKRLGFADDLPKASEPETLRRDDDPPGDYSVRVSLYEAPDPRLRRQTEAPARTVVCLSSTRHLAPRLPTR